MQPCGKEKKKQNAAARVQAARFLSGKTHLYRQIVRSNLKCLNQSDINKLLLYSETCVVGCVCAGRCVCGATFKGDLLSSLSGLLVYFGLPLVQKLTNSQRATVKDHKIQNNMPLLP